MTNSPRFSLDSTQLHYLRTVLGIETLVLPAVSDTGFAANEQPLVFFSGSLSEARLLALFPLARENCPLNGEAKDLVAKMMRAMKLADSEVAFAMWDFSESRPEVFAMLSSFTKPVVIFGVAGSAALLSGHTPQLGGVYQTNGVRCFVTHSPIDLLAQPELKRETWSHLREVMKEI